MRRAPPLAAIEAFVAAMQSATFREAADALAISPSAFSRRIAALEAHLGAPLFLRDAGRPTPTEAARGYLAEVQPSVEALQAAGETLRGAPARAAFRLLVAPSLAAEWLMPVLSEALAAARIADVAIEVGAPGCILDPARHDIAILAGVEADRPFDVLAPIEAAVVAAPEMADRRPPPAGPHHIADFDRLDMRFPESLWRRWSERSGAPMPRDSRAGRFASLATMYEAAAAGFGVALGVPLASERRLREGALRPCFRGLTPLGFDYRIVYRDARTRRRPEAQALAGYLREAAHASSTEFRRLAA